MFLLRTKLGLRNGIFWPTMGCSQFRCTVEWDWTRGSDFHWMTSFISAKGCVSSEGRFCESKAQRASVGDMKGATFIFHPHDTLMAGPLVISSSLSLPLSLEFRRDNVVKRVPQMEKWQRALSNQGTVWFGWLAIHHKLSEISRWYQSSDKK